MTHAYSYRLPAKPLLDAMEADCQGVIRDLGPAMSRAYFRLSKREEVAWTTIDHFCGAIGRHPSSVYGDDWWLLMAEIDEALVEEIGEEDAEPRDD